MNELFTVSISLSAEDVDEDEDDDVVGDVSGVLNDGVSDQKDGTKIFEAVGGQQESDSGGFNGITEDWFDFLTDVA